MGSPELPRLIKLDLEVGGVPVRLGADLASDEWRKACAAGGFSRVSLLGKLMLSGGCAAGTAFAAKNQGLGLFGGRVFAAPDLGGGPMKFRTSVSTFFRHDSLYRVVVRVTGNKKAASHFARQCAHALTRVVGNPSQLEEGRVLVWTGERDSLTLRRTADAHMVHELATGT